MSLIPSSPSSVSPFFLDVGPTAPGHSREISVPVERVCAIRGIGAICVRSSQNPGRGGQPIYRDAEDSSLTVGMDSSVLGDKPLDRLRRDTGRNPVPAVELDVGDVVTAVVQ